MKYTSFKTILVLALMVLIGVTSLPTSAKKKDKHPEVDYNVGCADCHAQVTPDAVTAWAASDHGIMNFGCYMCHGDGDENFEVKPSADRCYACHDDKQIDPKNKKIKSCYDCHKGHSLKFHQK